MHHNPIAAQIIAQMDADRAAGTSSFLPNPPTWRPEDYRDALRQVGMKALGADPGLLHPLASQMVDGFKTGLPDLARACIAIRHGDGAVPAMPSDAIKAAANSTADFPAVIADTANGISATLLAEAMGDLIALSAPVEAADYKPLSYSMVDLENVEPPSPEVMARNQYTFAKAKYTGELFRVSTTSVMLTLSGEAMANDDRALFRSSIAAFISVAARNEAKLAYGLFNANAVMESDGAPVFGAATGNLLTGKSLDKAGLGAAYAALRGQLTSAGSKADARASVLLVPAALELDALALAQTLSVRPMVIASSELAANVWYVLGNPRLVPVLARVTSEGSNGESVRFAELKPSHTTFGYYLPVRHTVGYALVNRVGCVRCEV